MKRGQLQLSFGMIFSILVIMGTIGAAFYFTSVFVRTSDCATVQVFQKEVQDSLDSAWRAAQVAQTVQLSAPRGVTSICMGDITRAQGLVSERTALDSYGIPGMALYLLPVEAACGGGKAGISVKHATSTFFCVPVLKGKVSFHLSKTNGTVQVEA